MLSASPTGRRDISRGHDPSGWGKALWFIFVLFIPLIGVLVYLIVRGGSTSAPSFGGGKADRSCRRVRDKSAYPKRNSLRNARMTAMFMVK
jgi:ABC-type Fe3+ transport system permease subunit